MDRGFGFALLTAIGPILHRIVYPRTAKVLPELTAITSDPFLLVGVRSIAGLAAVSGGFLMYFHSETP